MLLFALYTAWHSRSEAHSHWLEFTDPKLENVYFIVITLVMMHAIITIEFSTWTDLVHHSSFLTIAYFSKVSRRLVCTALTEPAVLPVHAWNTLLSTDDFPRLTIIQFYLCMCVCVQAECVGSNTPVRTDLRVQLVWAVTRVFLLDMWCRVSNRRFLLLDMSFKFTRGHNKRRCPQLMI